MSRKRRSARSGAKAFADFLGSGAAGSRFGGDRQTSDAKEAGKWGIA